MRAETKLFIGIGMFMLPLGLIYWFTSYEQAGSILLLVTALAFAFIGIYLGVESKKMDGLRPEDYDATQEEGAGEVGTFPGASIWPLIGAIAVTFMAFGLVFNTFLMYPGLALLLATVIGMARESGDDHAAPGHEAHDPHADAESTGTFSDQVKK